MLLLGWVIGQFWFQNLGRRDDRFRPGGERHRDSRCVSLCVPCMSMCVCVCEREREWGGGGRDCVCLVQP